MTFELRVLPKATEDVNEIVGWLADRSPSGAQAWFDAYSATLFRIEDSATSFGEAPENGVLDRDVRQALFRTRRGRTYRVLFFVDGRTATLLRVRAPGQRPVSADDIEEM